MQPENFSAFYCCRYSKNLVHANDYGIQKGIITGAGMGLLMLIIFGAYALAFWYGGKLVREDDYTAGRMLLVSILLKQMLQFYLAHYSLLV